MRGDLGTRGRGPAGLIEAAEEVAALVAKWEAKAESQPPKFFAFTSDTVKRPNSKRWKPSQAKRRKALRGHFVGSLRALDFVTARRRCASRKPSKRQKPRPWISVPQGPRVCKLEGAPGHGEAHHRMANKGPPIELLEFSGGGGGGGGGCRICIRDF